MGFNRELIKKLAVIAGELPPVTVQNWEYHYVSGAELIAQGDEWQDDGTPRKPDRLYKQPFPVILEVNHMNQLKKNYRQFGEDGIFAYIGAVEKRLQEENNA